MKAIRNSNPYLKSRVQSSNFSLWAELKRLFGGFRSLFTLLLVVLPLLLSLAGGLDYLSNWYYHFLHHVPATAVDKRIHVFFLQCATNDPAYLQICKGNNLPAWSNSHVLQFWPFLPIRDNRFFGLAKLLGQPDPIWYLGLLLLAFLAFVSIGNPRFKSVGATLADAFGLKRLPNTKTAKSSSGNKGVEKPLYLASLENQKIAPPPNLNQPQTNWVLGVAIPRLWNSDPGLFSTLLMPDKLSKKAALSQQPFLLTPDILRTNLLMVAPQGSGKTTCLHRPALSLARDNNAALFVWDAKGDDFSREEVDYNFDLLDFDHSFKLVIFSGDTPEAAGERLGEALIPEVAESKKYFSDVAKDALASIVAAHFAVNKLYPEIRQILAYINKDSDELNALIERVHEKVAEEDENEEEAKRLITNLVTSVKNLIEAKGDFLGNLRTALIPLTSPDIHRFLVANKTKEGTAYTVEELLRQPGLVRFGLAIAKYPRVAPIIGRLVLAQFVFAVLAPTCNREILKLALVDEAHNFVSLPTCKGMAQARSNNAGFGLTFQTLSQISEVGGDTLMETIFALSGTKIVMAGVGNKDASRFSETFGKVELEFVSHSTSSGRTSGNNSGGSRSSSSFMEFGTNRESGGGSKSSVNYGHNSSRTKNEGVNVQVKQRELFTAYEIRTLPQYHAVIEASDTVGQRYQAQIIDMSQSTVRVISNTFSEQLNQYIQKKTAAEQKMLEKIVAKNKDLLPTTIATNSVVPNSENSPTSNGTDIAEGQFVEVPANAIKQEETNTNKPKVRFQNNKAETKENGDFGRADNKVIRPAVKSPNPIQSGPVSQPVTENKQNEDNPRASDIVIEGVVREIPITHYLPPATTNKTENCPSAAPASDNISEYQKAIDFFDTQLTIWKQTGTTISNTEVKASDAAILTSAESSVSKTDYTDESLESADIAKRDKLNKDDDNRNTTYEQTLDEFAAEPSQEYRQVEASLISYGFDQTEIFERVAQRFEEFQELKAMLLSYKVASEKTDILTYKLLLNNRDANYLKALSKNPRGQLTSWLEFAIHRNQNPLK